MSKQIADVQCACRLFFIKSCQNMLKTHKGKQQEHKTANFSA